VNVALIYSKALGTLRRIVIPDSQNSELNDPAHQAGFGEARILIPKEDYDHASSPAELQVLLNRYTGLNPGPHADRFVLLDPCGKVIGAIIDDPACHPTPWWPAGHSLMQHSEACVGWGHKEGFGLIKLEADPLAEE
jgi:hypothetical protein